MTTAAPQRRDRFRHEALLYAGDEEFVDECAAFVAEGVAEDEAVMVVVAAPKIDLLRARLGSTADTVRFADMSAVGRNPSRIIGVWQRFLDDHPGAPCRGIGEPIGPERSADELTECQRHEVLLNIAFRDTTCWILCPYDTARLAPPVVAEALRSHPWVAEFGTHRHSPSFDPIVGPFTDALTEPVGAVAALDFDIETVGDVCRVLAAHHAADRLGRERLDDFVLGVSEVAANSIRHGDGHGTARVWSDGEALFCEITDTGYIVDPLVGRRLPVAGGNGGHGLWIAHHLCDLVQLRSHSTGTTVRLSMRYPAD
jgi:anti-sigma regulatory factor (Ser/Thr protein kinase)